MADDIPFPGGPPDPIAFLRRLSSEADGLSDERKLTATEDRKRRAQDPPARERPAVSSEYSSGSHSLILTHE
jgi:hypothetical protein